MEFDKLRIIRRDLMFELGITGIWEIKITTEKKRSYGTDISVNPRENKSTEFLANRNKSPLSSLRFLNN